MSVQSINTSLEHHATPGTGSGLNNTINSPLTSPFKPIQNVTNRLFITAAHPVAPCADGRIYRRDSVPDATVNPTVPWVARLDEFLFIRGCEKDNKHALLHFSIYVCIYKHTHTTSAPNLHIQCIRLMLPDDLNTDLIQTDKWAISSHPPAPSTPRPLFSAYFPNATFVSVYSEDCGPSAVTHCSDGLQPGVWGTRAYMYSHTPRGSSSHGSGTFRPIHHAGLTSTGARERTSI